MKQTISSGWSPNIFSADLFWSSVIVVVVQLACSWNVFVHVSRKKRVRTRIITPRLEVNRCLCVSTPLDNMKELYNHHSWIKELAEWKDTDVTCRILFSYLFFLLSYLFFLRRPFNPLGSAVVINIFKEEEVEGGLEGICVSTFRPVTLGSFVVKEEFFFPSFRQKKKTILTNSLSFPHVIDACCVIISFRKLSTGSRREAR